jgi:2-iminobutanoate/2-iminopropanoate deaminase
MEKKVIYTDQAPEPIGPYSQAILVDGTLYCSGQIAINAASGSMVIDNIEHETRQVMANVGHVLEAAGMNFDNVVKTSIFLRNMDDFSQMNKVYGSYFSTDFPARETVQVSRLPKDVNVEISVIARAN